MDKIKFVLNEITFYFLIQTLGLVSSWKILKSQLVQKQILGPKISWFDLIIAVFLSTILIFLIIKFLKPKVPYKLFFGFLFFVCSFYTLNIWFSSLFAFILTLLLFISHFKKPKIFTHNLIITLTLIWVGISLGLYISIWEMLIIFVIFSIYDLIAVLKTKHMITLFKELAERGVVFALIIPKNLKNLFSPIPKIEKKSEFLFLGTGDIALPMVFLISVFYSTNLSFPLAFFIILGTLVGILSLNLIIFKIGRKPLPALPPLALGAILGWLIGKLIL
jgi:presenilin-like A22 family membrane protease